MNNQHAPKIIGSDSEIGNALVGVDSEGGTGEFASRLLLKQISGIDQFRPPSGTFQHASSTHGFAAQGFAANGFAANGGWPVRRAVVHDAGAHGRKFLLNGGSAYIDLDHLELPTAPVRCAYRFNAAFHAMLTIASQAVAGANAAGVDPQVRVVAMANNSDGLGHSYGSHMNFMISRAAFQNIFDRKLHYLLLLASYQASSIVFTGQGKVGAENGAPPVDFQISQRADFFEMLTGPQTTSRRPLVNSRDESLCGNAYRTGSPLRMDDRYARLHCIVYDSNLCHVANVLKAGVMQIILTMIEAECLDPAWILDDPVTALVAWSHDPSLRAQARLTSGSMTTAVALQRRFCEAAADFVNDARCDPFVPRAREIVALWSRILDDLEARAFGRLSECLDWVLKQQILQNVLDEHPQLDWSSPQMKQLDHCYSDLDRTEGLFWAMERSGAVRRLADDGEIDALVDAPPHDTRAYAHANLLRRAGAERVESVDWDRITLRLADAYGWASRRTVLLPDPSRGTKAETEALFHPPGESLQTIAAAINEIARDASSQKFQNTTTNRTPGESDHGTRRA